jgi:hypothetical protein
VHRARAFVEGNVDPATTRIVANLVEERESLVYAGVGRAASLADVRQLRG